jgi:hypothetical protein
MTDYLDERQQISHEHWTVLYYLIYKHPVCCYMCMHLLRLSFNTFILGYKIMKFIDYMFQ